MPECSGHVGPDRSLFAIGQLDHRSRSLPAHTGQFATDRAGILRAGTRPTGAHRAYSCRLRLSRGADTRILTACIARLRLQRIAIPLRIVEVVMRSYKIPDRKIVLAFE